MSLTLSQFPQTILTNPSKLRIYLCENFYCDHRNFDSGPFLPPNTRLIMKRIVSL
jgi:hypothetical protein